MGVEELGIRISDLPVLSPKRKVSEYGMESLNTFGNITIQ